MSWDLKTTCNEKNRRNLLQCLGWTSYSKSYKKKSNLYGKKNEFLMPKTRWKQCKQWKSRLDIRIAKQKPSRSASVIKESWRARWLNKNCNSRWKGNKNWILKMVSRPCPNSKILIRTSLNCFAWPWNLQRSLRKNNNRMRRLSATPKPPVHGTKPKISNKMIRGVTWVLAAPCKQNKILIKTPK